MPKPQIQRVASYGLIRDKRRILLCRISDKIPKWSGFWTLPGGGIEFGEHPADAMIREVREETGLIVRSADLAGINSNTGESDDHLFHGIRIVYHAEQTGGRLTNEVDGTTDLCRWCHIDEIDSLSLVELARIGIEWAFAGSSVGFQHEL